MPPKKTQTKSKSKSESKTVEEPVSVSKSQLDNFLVTKTSQVSQKQSHAHTPVQSSHVKSNSKSKSKSQKMELDENGFPIIKLIFQENLLKSLNKIYEKQNHELLKIISLDKTIPMNDLMNFMDDQPCITVKEIDSP